MEKNVKVNALFFSKEQAEVIQRHVDELTKRETDIYEKAYNTGLSYGYRIGIVMMGIVLFAVIVIVWLVFNSPLRITN